MVFRTEQVALSRSDVGPDQPRPTGLENLVVGTAAKAGQVWLLREAAGRGHGLLDEVGNGAQGQRLVEPVAEQFASPPERTRADEHQSQDQLSQPGLGDGHPEKPLVGLAVVAVNGLVQSVVGVVELLVNERAADLVSGGPLAERLASEGVKGPLLALVGEQGVGGSGQGLFSDRGAR